MQLLYRYLLYVRRNSNNNPTSASACSDGSGDSRTSCMFNHVSNSFCCLCSTPSYNSNVWVNPHTFKYNPTTPLAFSPPYYVSSTFWVLILSFILPKGNTEAYPMQAKPFFHSIRFQFILEYRTHKIDFLAKFSFVK